MLALIIIDMYPAENDPIVYVQKGNQTADEFIHQAEEMWKEDKAADADVLDENNTYWDHTYNYAQIQYRDGSRNIYVITDARKME